MDKQISDLVSILTQQVAAHEQLLGQLKRKRKLLQTADHHQLARVSAQENQLVQLISEREKQRLVLVAELTLRVDPAAKEPMGLVALAQRLDEPERGQLLVLREQLKQRMESVRQETTVATQVTESLVRHMQGLIQTVGSAISGVGLYSNRGSLPTDVMAVRTFNVTA